MRAIRPRSIVSATGRSVSYRLAMIWCKVSPFAIRFQRLADIVNCS